MRLYLVYQTLNIIFCVVGNSPLHLLELLDLPGWSPVVIQTVEPSPTSLFITPFIGLES